MKKIIKGFIVGITNVIPGVCSALVAISLNIYQNIIEITSYPFRKNTWKKNYQFIIGIILGIIFSIIAIDYCFKKWPFVILALFLGITIYGVVPLHKKIRKFNIVNLLELLLGVGVVSLSNIIKVASGNNVNMILFAVAGALASIAFIMPGVSGSMMLLILGVYFPLLSMIVESAKTIFSFKLIEFTKLINLLIFFISFIITLIVSSRIIGVVMKKYEKHFFSICLGMVYGTIGILIYTMIPFYTLPALLIGVPLLIIGFLIVFKIGND